jgi:hypothetical protein
MNRQDMLFLVQDYLASLKEREELDAILPDLLRAMGFQIVKLAFRGEVQHGVDIAAIRREDGETVLYLIQVKAGDIDAGMWDSGPNTIRPTLNNLLDVPFKDLTQPRLQQARRKAILVHNGQLRENIRVRFNGYIEDTFGQHMAFERWGLDKLAPYFCDHLLSERILPKEHQRLLKRTLVFLDVPDYDLSDFKQLVREILPDVKKLGKPKRSRIFGFIRLVLAMIKAECQGLNNLSSALVAYEYALLSIWGWMRRNGFFQRPVVEEFVHTYFQYLQLLLEWAEKVAPALCAPAGLAFGGTYELLEYPMRTFEVVGNLGLLATALAYLPDSEFKHQHLRRVIELLVSTIRTNPARHKPLLDNHSIDIFLGMWPLILTGHTDLARWWLRDILEHLVIRRQFYKRLPELSNRVDAVIEYEATGERPVGYVDSSSTLIYMLFEFCLLLDGEELYLNYREAFEGISLQVWYPPEHVEEIIYSREVSEGDTEVIHGLPASFEEFRLDVQARHQFDRMDYSPMARRLPAILLLANKHFRTPVFPFWWRTPVFAQASEALAKVEKYLSDEERLCARAGTY